MNSNPIKTINYDRKIVNNYIINITSLKKFKKKGKLKIGKGINS